MEIMEFRGSERGSLVFRVFWVPIQHLGGVIRVPTGVFWVPMRTGVVSFRYQIGVFWVPSGRPVAASCWKFKGFYGFNRSESPFRVF